MSTVVIDSKKNPGCLIQLLWFIFIGWWLGQLWIAVAWILMLTIVGIPIGVMMMNKVPKVIALREKAEGLTVTTTDTTTVITQGAKTPQLNIIIRAVYFVFIGWWLSALWIEIAYFFCVIIIGMPLGFWMFDKVPVMVSLRR